MKSTPFQRTRFPQTSGLNGSFRLPYTAKALLRAVIAAGNNPDCESPTPAARYDLQSRVATLKSALDMSGTPLRPTRHFLDEGPSDKTYKSFQIGNAVCAHAAQVVLKIPWLVNVEKLIDKDVVYPPLAHDEKRPDYLGRTINREWHIFESKCRSSPNFTQTDLEDWKQQANAVSQVKGKPVVYNIVSITYLTRSNDWNLIWRDPPIIENGTVVRFDEDVFFRAYYSEIHDYIRTHLNKAVPTDVGLVVPVGETGVWLGFHKEIAEAVKEREWRIITSFAGVFSDSDLVQGSGDGVAIFPDGLIIKLGPEWSKEAVSKVSLEAHHRGE